MIHEVKCPYCGCSDFDFDDFLEADLEMVAMSPTSDVYEENAYSGSHPLNDLTRVICKNCGHVGFFKNNSEFVINSRYPELFQEAKPLLEEILGYQKEIELIEEKMQTLDPNSQQYGDSENRIKRLNNKIQNVSYKLDYIKSRTHLSEEELIKKCL